MTNPSRTYHDPLGPFMPEIIRDSIKPHIDDLCKTQEFDSITELRDAFTARTGSKPAIARFRTWLALCGFAFQRKATLQTIEPPSAPPTE